MNPTQTGSTMPGDCINCEVNQYQTAPGSTKCIDCNNNSKSDEGSTFCDKCPEGRYMTGNPRACVNCPSGKSSVYGQSVCQICVSGQYANADIEATSCELCPIGQHGIANITQKTKMTSHLMVLLFEDRSWLLRLRFQSVGRRNKTNISSVLELLHHWVLSNPSCFLMVEWLPKVSQTIRSITSKKMSRRLR